MFTLFMCDCVSDVSYNMRSVAGKHRGVRAESGVHYPPTTESSKSYAIWWRVWTKAEPGQF